MNKFFRIFIVGFSHIAINGSRRNPVLDSHPWKLFMDDGSLGITKGCKGEGETTDCSLYFLKTLSSADHTCTNWDYYDNELSCDYGCCDTWPYETCCPEDKHWLGWAIAGGVIGGIIILSLIVCLLCAFVKKKGKPGRVIQPNQANADPLSYQPNVTYISYPQSQVQLTYPQLPPYTPSAPPPPSYQSVYSQQPLPPIPAGLQQHGYHHIT